MFRDVLLSTDGHQIAPVDLPGGGCFVRTMTAGEKDEFDRQVLKDGRARCRIVMVCCCTEDGKPEFTNLDLPALDALPFFALDPIVNAALRINRLTAEDVEDVRKK
jgi:hypothetical protein